MSKIPAPFCRTTSSNTDIEHIIYSLRRKATQYMPFQSFTGEWLFAFKIPPFQRNFVWTEAQCVKFIESVWMGFDIGSYLVNRLPWVGKLIPEYDDFLIDGLQRITAIHKYVSNEFKVFGYYYNELDESDRRRFEGTQFTCNTVSINDIRQLEELYDRLNYGGTPHTEEERHGML